MNIFGLQVSYSTLPLVIFGLIGVYLFIKMSGFVKHQMREGAHSYKKRVGHSFTRFVFSVIVTLAILFIMAFVVSSIAINTIFGIQETKLVFFDAMADPWRFSTLLLILFGVLTVFIIFYPLLDFHYLAKKKYETPTTIHSFLKRRFFSNKHTKLMPFLMWFLLVILPPSVISTILIRVDIQQYFGYQFSSLTLIMIVFVAYEILGPIMYLAYFQNITTAGVITQQRYIKKSAKNPFSKGKRNILVILVIMAIISLISSIYTFAKSLPVLWGVYPQLTTTYTTTASDGFIQSLIVYFMQQGGATHLQIDQFLLFNAIVPIDFLIFIITTVLFGLLGLYMKFWSRHSFRKPQIVWFGAYMICGLSFQIFVKIVMQWPWILPNFGVFDMSVGIFQNIMVVFFSLTFVLTNAMMVGFFIYHIGWDSELKKITIQGLEELGKPEEGEFEKEEEKRIEKKKKRKEKKEKKKKEKEEKNLAQETEENKET